LKEMAAAGATKRSERASLPAREARREANECLMAWAHRKNTAGAGGWAHKATDDMARGVQKVTWVAMEQAGTANGSWLWIAATGARGRVRVRVVLSLAGV
jgi:hypothetical protein